MAFQDMEKLPCYGKGDIFFPEEGDRTLSGRALIKAMAPAQEICRGCKIQTECLTYAMEMESLVEPSDYDPNKNNATYRYGVWGGFTPRDRSRLAKGA